MAGSTKVGTFRVSFFVSNITQPDKRVSLEGLVDTGATYPFIPEDTLQRLNIQPQSHKKFTFADGSQKEMSIGEARISLNGASAPCLVVFAPPKTEPLFGALALESLGLEVDPVNRRLKPATLYLAQTTF